MKETTRMYSSTMNKYFKNSTQPDQYVAEGWGIALTRLGIFTAGMAGIVAAAEPVATGIAKTVGTGIAGQTAAGVAGAVMGFGAGQAIVHGQNFVVKKITASMFDKMTKSKALSRYIIKQCDKAYSELKKSNKNIIANIDTTSFTRCFNAGAAADREINLGELLSTYSARNNTENKLLKFGQYHVDIFFDSNSISAIVVVFGYKDCKTDFIGRRIPAPSQSELSAMLKEH